MTPRKNGPPRRRTGAKHQVARGSRVIDLCRELCGAGSAPQVAPHLLIAESRAEVGGVIEAAARNVGMEVSLAATLGQLLPIARKAKPTAAMIHLGFDDRAGPAAATSLRSLLPHAALVLYAEPADASLVPVAEAHGLGPFVVWCAPGEALRELAPRIRCAATVAACLQRVIMSRRKAPVPLEFNGATADLQIGMIRTALQMTPSIRRAATELGLREGTLRGKMRVTVHGGPAA